MIGRSGERGSGISVLAARHDDDDDDDINIQHKQQWIDRDKYLQPTPKKSYAVSMVVSVQYYSLLVLNLVQTLISV